MRVLTWADICTPIAAGLRSSTAQTRTSRGCSGEHHKHVIALSWTDMPIRDDIHVAQPPTNVKGCQARPGS